MDREILVSVDLHGTPVFAGRLWWRSRKGRESASFEYDPGWLEHPERFALEPALGLTPGPFHTGPRRSLFGALGDSTPDRWGRLLMRRAERRRARREGRAPRALSEPEVLLLVDDEARQGALRFSTQPTGPFLAEPGSARIPPLVELPRLLAGAERVADDREGDDDLRLLLGPGSSLGGARPKASVRDTDGRLCIAKFPHPQDELNVVLWEGRRACACRSERHRSAGTADRDHRRQARANRRALRPPRGSPRPVSFRHEHARRDGP